MSPSKVAALALGLGITLIPAACSLGEGASTGIHCGADGDGGSMDVDLRDASTILLRIPDGARLWRPGTEGEERTPRKARFGEDDKVFKLTRAASPRQCLSMLGKE